MASKVDPVLTNEHKTIHVGYIPCLWMEGGSMGENRVELPSTILLCVPALPRPKSLGESQSFGSVPTTWHSV